MEVEVEEWGQKNKEDVASKNTCKVGLLGKIGNKVKKKGLGRPWDGAKGEGGGIRRRGGGIEAEKQRRCPL